MLLPGSVLAEKDPVESVKSAEMAILDIPVTSVKNYATPIITMLRAAGNKNLVIVGTPSWSQRPSLHRTH